MAAPILLLVGATGFIGQRLLPVLAKRWKVVATSRDAKKPDALALDLGKPASLAATFVSFRPAAVVHAGGMADPDICEREPELAHRVNVEAVRVLAGLCAQARARLVHFSTDYVFDGEKSWYREGDVARPLSVYGRSKLDSERTVLSNCPGGVVLRVSNCYGRLLGGRRTYLDQWHDRLHRGLQVRAFTDQWRTPTAGDQLPEVVVRLLERQELRGVFHWGGADRASRYDAAITYCRAMGYDEQLVERARAADHAFDAPRPRDSSLDSSKLAVALGIAPVGLQAGFEALKPHGTSPLDTAHHGTGEGNAAQDRSRVSAAALNGVGHYASDRSWPDNRRW